MVLVLALVLLAEPPADALAVADHIEPAGWSADETRVALRLFGNEPDGKHADCAGYVDATGQPFAGGLTLAVLENGALTQSFVIQDPPTSDAASCTSPAVAKERLTKAKDALAKLGIDLKRPGTALPMTRQRLDEKRNLLVVAGAPVTHSFRDVFTAGPLEVRFDVKDVCEAMVCHANATLTWSRGPNGGVAPLDPFEYSQLGNGVFDWSLSAAIESPSKKVLLPFIDGHHAYKGGHRAHVRLIDTVSKRGPVLK